jgi:hypothetical protein
MSTLASRAFAEPPRKGGMRMSTLASRAFAEPPAAREAFA